MKLEGYLTLKEFREKKGITRQMVHKLITGGKINVRYFYNKPLIIDDVAAQSYQKTKQYYNRKSE